MLGSSLLLGSSAPMRPLAADVASVEPPALVAVTTTRTVEPTSVEMRPSVVPVAPEISLQASPLALHCSHW